MARNKFSVFVFIIIGLAVVGLFSQLFTNTANFFTNIFMMLGVGIAFFAVIYFVFLRKRAPSDDMKKYKQAVKQSKAKYKQYQSASNPSTNTNKKQSVRLKKSRNSRRATHLRVIDGNKSKGKDRATF